jgi:hypothetical protein
MTELVSRPPIRIFRGFSGLTVGSNGDAIPNGAEGFTRMSDLAIFPKRTEASFGLASTK